MPRDLRGAALSSIARFSLPALDRTALAAEDELRLATGEPWRFASPEEVLLTPASSGTWQSLGESTRLWRLRIEAPGARSLNIGFTRFGLPEGAQLLIYAADESTFIRPFTADDNRAHGELWTPHLPTDDVIVELSVPEALESVVELELGFVNQGYRGFGPHQGPREQGGLEALAARSGSCNVDVACSQANGWGDQIRAVGVYSIQGIIACTGTMLNNTEGDLRPLFLTADHCGITPGNDQTVVVFWNYQNSSCRTPGSSQSGGAGNGQLNRFQSGSTLRANWSGTDFALIELDDAPNPAWGVYWAGWERTSGSPPSAVGIHHPNGEEKRISFENDPLITTSAGGSTSPGNGRFLRVADWDLGTTEPGSSGSGLFNPQKRLIGQLFGGDAACGNDDPDWYGRLSASWDGAGSSSSRLRDWLDPSGSGARNTNGTDRATDPEPDPDPTLEAPSNLTATATSMTEVQLTWQDNSSEELDFLVQRRKAGEENHMTVAVMPANSTSRLVDGLEPGTEYFFRVRARRGNLKSPFTPEVNATTFPDAPPPVPPPARPTRLEAVASSSSGGFLSWRDEAQDETGYEVEVSEDGIAFSLSDTLPANATGTIFAGLQPLTHRYYRVRAVNEGGSSAYSNTAQVTTDGPVEVCVEDEMTLCLKNSRFRVSAQWTTAAQGTNPAMAESLTGDTGYFWFFSQGNVEIVLKALEGCNSNEHFWVFATGLTNVGVEILVLDTSTGKAQTYVSPLGMAYQPVFDTEAFATCP